MSDSRLGTAEQLRDPDYTPPLGQAIPLGIQHVLAMFVSNVTPAIIIAFAAGFGFGSPDAGTLVYLIQMSILFAGIATLLQTIGMGPIGARLPIVQGTSFAYLPVMIPAMAGAGVAGLGGLMTGVIVGGIFHFCIGFFIKGIRFALPPLVTGLIVLMIGLALMKVGIEYAAGGVPAYEAMLKEVMTAKFARQPVGDISGLEFGSLQNWFVALVVIVVTLCVKFFSRGFMSVAAVLIGLIVGYIVAMLLGMVSFSGVGRAAWFAIPNPFRWGFEWNWAIIIGMCLMSFISAIETVGDVSGITKGGAGREATDDEIQGATFADGLGTAVSGIFGGLPNTSFSQNVGLISMTGVMSRGVVTIGAIFLIICGFIPKIGAIISTVPIEVLGGGVIIMFGMVAAAGVRMLSDVVWNRRNMIIFATALSVGLGLQLVPEALQHLGGTWKILLTSGLLPAAFIAIVLNLLLPEDESDGSEAAFSGLRVAEDRSHGGAGEMAGAGSRAISGMADNAATHAGQKTSAVALAGGAAALAAGGAVASAKSAGSSAVSRAKSGTNAAGAAASSTAKKAATATKRAGASVSAKAKTTAKPAAKKAKGAAKSAAKSTSSAVKSAASKSKSAAKSVKKSVAKPASKAAKSATSSAKSATKSVKKAASKATSPAAKSAASAAKPAAKTKAKAVRKAPSKATKAVSKATSKTASKSASKSVKTAKRSLVGSALDDLEFVDGVGPKTAKSLKSAGVKNLSGLVAMSDANLEGAASKAGTGGRPKSENWKGQAKSILAGKPPRAKSDRAAWERAKKKMG